jgi:hypothetical protein
MFKVKAPETFAATLTMKGQGREQKLKLVYRHRQRSAYAELMKDLADGKKDTAQAILELVESWEADAELDVETLRALAEDQPGTDWAILTGYGEALAVARKGN